MYKQFLDSAMDTLFKPVEDNGFWDKANGRIAERLEFDQSWQWSYLPSDRMRYMVFCLSSLLVAKDLYQLGTEDVDDKIISSLKYLNSKKKDLLSSDMTYGALLSVFLQNKFYTIPEIDLKEWETVFEDTLNSSLQRKDNHDALILIAGKYFLQLNPGHPLKEKLKKMVDGYLASHNLVGYFETGDLRANYHQRNMYVLWGLLAAADFYPEKREAIKLKAGKTLNWVWESRRDGKDDAFLWHPAIYSIKNKINIKIPVLNYTHSKFLFECHQTFFVNAVNFYQKQFETTEFEAQKIKAMGWIFGDNRIKKDLTAITGLKLPVRIMHTNGDLFIKGQNFKGTYEIGSYILALSSFDK